MKLSRNLIENGFVKVGDYIYTDYDYILPDLFRNKKFQITNIGLWKITADFDRNRITIYDSKFEFFDVVQNTLITE